MNHYSINHLLNKMNDTNNSHLNITDMSGHTFCIRLCWDACLMKCQIAQLYEGKYKNDFCNDKGITIRDFNRNEKYRWEWYNSDYYKTLESTYYKLIYKGEILEQYHVEADLITLEDLQEHNNMNVVICKNNHDNDDNYNSSTDDDDDNNSDD